MPEKFLAKVDELQRTKSNVIIAASEGVKTAEHGTSVSTSFPGPASWTPSATRPSSAAPAATSPSSSTRS